AYACLSVVLCLGLPGSVRAQTNGALRGAVRDGAGSPLGGAAVAVASRSQGVSGRAAVTDSSGSFQTASLPPARDYTVTATSPGFAAADLPDVEIQAGRTTRLRITLQPGSSLRERVEVRARPQVVDLEDTASTTRLSSEFIDG